MEYWIDLGVDGFRLDVINLIGKQRSFESVEDPYHLAYLSDQPPVHEYHVRTVRMP